MLPEVAMTMASSPPPFQKEEGERLLELCRRFEVANSFHPKQLVQWKPGLEQLKLPETGRPAVVMEVFKLPEVLFDGTEWLGTGMFRTPVDMVVGVIDKEGKLVRLHVDSRRMEPWRGGKT